MTKRVFLGMSGGVDSSVSAVLLKEQGYDVTGVYMKNWSEDLPGLKCPWAEDLADAKRVAVGLDLDFEVWDFEAEYKRRVVDYMLAEFARGRTPNPDVMCNEQIKFKLFYERALAEGADFIATGHYARVGMFETERGASCSVGESLRKTFSGQCPDGNPPSRKSPSADSSADHNDVTSCPAKNGVAAPANGRSGQYQLLRAVDENKDQTYFLYRMSLESTAQTLFPVGAMTKPAVKALAMEKGLDVATKKESMGVCFVGEVGMKDFLRQYIDVQPGEIREIETGRMLGSHDGAIFYTLGQRHGLYLGGGLPYYVVRKDLEKNIVYVSRNLNDAHLWKRKLLLEDVKLRQALPSSGLKVRLRHRAPLLPVEFEEDRLVFSEPIKAPAPGQSAVLYAGEVCLGGGIVASTTDTD